MSADINNKKLTLPWIEQSRQRVASPASLGLFGFEKWRRDPNDDTCLFIVDEGKLINQCAKF